VIVVTPPVTPEAGVTLRGPQGDPGLTGPVGESGSSAYESAVAGGFEGTESEWQLSLVGHDGAQGIVGEPGPKGEQGASGELGIEGPVGLPGKDGLGGVQGDVGPAGADGAVGAQGLTGATGLDGPQGLIGPDGLQGPSGIDGAPGLVGEAGPQGIPGDPGPVGEAGAAGVQGDVGPQGIQGLTGAMGIGGSADVRINFVRDPSFEVGADPYGSSRSDWDGLSGTYSSELGGRDSTESDHHGRLVSDSDALCSIMQGYDDNLPPYSSGKPFTYSMYVRGTVGTSVYLHLRWKATSNRVISEVAGETVTLTSTTEYQRISMTGIIPESTGGMYGDTGRAEIRLRFQPAAAGDIVEMDDALLEWSDSLGVYFDGNTSGTPDSNTRMTWVETAEDSPGEDVWHLGQYKNAWSLLATGSAAFYVSVDYLFVSRGWNWSRIALNPESQAFQDRQYAYVTETGDGTVELSRGARLIIVESTAATRFRIYRTAEQRTADVDRAATTAPVGDAVLAEFVFDAASIGWVNPVVDLTGTGTTFYTRTDGVATITITWERTA